MGPSWWQILVVLVLIVLLFGRDKISELMGDFARGIKNFQKGIEENEEAPEPKAIGRGAKLTASPQRERSHSAR
jgi:sec-independent protein translocase protein TatA